MSKIYAIIGTSQQTIIADTVSYQPQTKEVLMKSERPSEGEYVANENGEWVVPEPSIDERIAQLDAQYNSDKAVLVEQYTEADIIEDFELKASIKVELATLQAEYDRAYEKIIGGEE